MNPKSARLPGKNDAPVHAGVAGGWLDLDRVRVYSAALLVLFAALLIRNLLDLNIAAIGIHCR